MEKPLNPTEQPLFSLELADFINLCLQTIQTGNGEHLTQIITPEEFWSGGYLQEANRRFFHPLGLALTVQIDEDSGEIKLGQILDGRHDPEGIRFARGMASVVKGEKIDDEWTHKSEVRMKALGYVVQPIM